jgi:hypothetical protein
MLFIETDQQSFEMKLTRLARLILLNTGTLSHIELGNVPLLCAPP